MPLDLDWLQSRMPGRPIVWFDSIPSTMPEAASLAARDCPAGTLVVAEEQTAGQGRLGRSWYSERELGLYISIVIRPAVHEASLQLVTLAAGLAVQESIQLTSGVPCQIKWPNDLLAFGKKCGGILCQTAGDAVIAGVGVNVNHLDFPEELAGLATSLRQITGRTHSREELLVQIAENLENYCGLLEREGAGSILRLYAGRARPR